MKELYGIWEKVLADLRSAIPEREYALWISPLALSGAMDSEAIILAPNKFVAQWATERYLALIRQALARQLNAIERVTITHVGTLNHQSSPRAKEPKPFLSNIRSSLTFSCFLTSQENKLACETAKAVCASPGQLYNPLYIFCKHHAGKTHLLHAIGNAILSRPDFQRPLYLSCSKSEKAFAMLRNLNPLKVSAVLMDDLDESGFTPKEQERITALLDKMQHCGVQMVFAAKVAPSRIPAISPALRSRLEGGVICRLEPYDLSTRTKILRLRAPGRTYISEELAKKIALSCEDIKTCIQYLVRVQTYCSLKKIPIERVDPLEVLGTNTGQGKTDAANILYKTSRHFNIPIEDLLSKRKGRSVTYPRKLAIYLIKTLSLSRSREIAHIFSFKDSSTVYRALAEIKSGVESNSSLVIDLTAITEAVTGKKAVTQIFN